MSSAAVQKLAPVEVEQGRLHLERTLAGVLAATEGLSEAQWTFKPAPDRWSIAEIVEHVVIVDGRVFGAITERLAQTPLAANPDSDKVDAIILERFADRSARLPAPDALRPSGRWTRSDALERLREHRGKLIGCLESVPGLRLHVLESLPLKVITQGTYTVMDGYEWLLAAGAHAERHTRQILEVRADASFPVE